MRKVPHIILIFLLIVLINSCASTIRITSVLERDTDGDLLLKWEVSPDQEGNIDILSSDSDASLDRFSPIASAQITDQVIRFSSDRTDTRQFFMLRTPAALSGIVTNRMIDTEGIRNFRDAGGYFTTDNRQMRWGMLFRSGDLSNATLHDQTVIRQLGIRTIIDFRSERSARQFPILLHPNIRVVPLPLVIVDLEKVEEQMENDNFDRSDAIRFMQQMYVEIVTNHKEEFAQMFDILINPYNYPVLLTESLGKDGVGLAIFFILYAIGIPESVLMYEYMFNSQSFIETTRSMIGDGQHLSESMQQAITAMLTVERAYLSYAIQHIRRTYGSVSNYLENELRVTSAKRSLLRRHLLYPF